MPVEVNFLEDRGVEVLGSGLVDGREIIRANEAIINDERVRDLRYKLIDKSACTEYVVSAEDVKKIAELNRIISEANPGIVIAVVESSRLQFSLTNLWQALIDQFDIKNNSFQSRDAALEWINNHLS